MDIFSSENLNRAYNRILKIKLLLIFLLKLVITELGSYDVVSMRSHIKKIIVSFSETMAMFIDAFIFFNVNPSFLSEYKTLVDRVSKLLRSNNTKTKKRNEELFSINKLLDYILNSIKTLMK